MNALEARRGKVPGWPLGRNCALEAIDMKVGYIGLGAMGGFLARHLVKSHELMVWDLNDQAVADLVGMGAKAASTGAELARAWTS